MAGQNDPASGEVIYGGTKRSWLLIGEEHEGGGVTDETYSKRYVLLWSALNCALQRDIGLCVSVIDANSHIFHFARATQNWRRNRSVTV
jgi:hypothetical protein